MLQNPVVIRVWKRPKSSLLVAIISRPSKKGFSGLRKDKFSPAPPLFDFVPFTNEHPRITLRKYNITIRIRNSKSRTS